MSGGDETGATAAATAAAAAAAAGTSAVSVDSDEEEVVIPDEFVVDLSGRALLLPGSEEEAEDEDADAVARRAMTGGNGAPPTGAAGAATPATSSSSDLGVTSTAVHASEVGSSAGAEAVAAAFAAAAAAGESGRGDGVGVDMTVLFGGAGGAGPLSRTLTSTPAWGAGVRELVLMGTRLTGVIGAIGAHLPALEVCCLRQNLLEAIGPDSFAGLTRLRRLELNDNAISEIEHLDLPSLRVLDLSYNSVRHIRGLERLPELRELYLVQNKVREIGEGLRAVRGTLRLLELGGNRLRRLENVAGFPQLRELWLGKNKIPALESLEELPRLAKLDVQANRLTSLHGVEGLPALEQLMAGHNGLTSAAVGGSADADVACAATLQILDVSGNQIASLADAGLHRFAASLTEFWCTNNQLSSYQELEDQLRPLPKLFSVMLEQNPLARDVQYQNKLLGAIPQITQIDASDVQHTAVSKALAGIQ